MKKFLAIVLALAMVMSLVACGGNKDNQTLPDSSAEIDNVQTPDPAPEVDKINAYLEGAEYTEGMHEITSMDYVRLVMPKAAYEESVGYQEYMMASMLALSAAFGGDISESGMTMEEVEAILNKPMVMDLADAFSYINPMTTATAVVTVMDNTDNLTIDSVTLENAQEILNTIGDETTEEPIATEDETEVIVSGEEVEGVETVVGGEDEVLEVEITDEKPNMLTTETPDAAITMAPDTEVADTEVTDDKEVDTKAEDTTVDGSIETTGEAVEGEVGTGDTIMAEVDTTIYVNEEIARADDKVIFSIKTNMEVANEDGTIKAVEATGYATLITCEGKLCAAMIVSDAANTIDWDLKFIQGVNMDAEFKSTLTAEDDFFGITDGAITGDETEVTGDEAIENTETTEDVENTTDAVSEDTTVQQ